MLFIDLKFHLLPSSFQNSKQAEKSGVSEQLVYPNLAGVILFDLELL